MLFLLNDVVFRIDGEAMEAELSGRTFMQLSLPEIVRAGQESYAREPLLQRTKPDEALRLAALNSVKAPMINAALFVAPSVECKADEVAARFVSAQFEVMADLFTRHQAGKLDAVSADKQIWRRLAA